MSEREGDLITRARDGSLEAFDALVALHQDRVHALAYRILGNREDAADVQQETFVRAWRSLGLFRGDSAFATWLHRITVNLCLSRKRRTREPEPEYSDDLAAHSGEPSASDCLERAETVELVRRVLGALPAHYRVLLVLREIEERSFDEIAQVLGCSTQSARARASRARQMLRERLMPFLAEEEL